MPQPNETSAAVVLRAEKVLKGSGGSFGLPGAAAGTGRQAASHQPDYNPLDHRLGVRGPAFVVPAHTAVSGDPGMRALDRPAARQRDEALLADQLGHHLHQDALSSVREVLASAAVGGVGPDQD